MTPKSLSLAAFLIGQAVIAAAAASRPNIVVVMADDIGFPELGC